MAVMVCKAHVVKLVYKALVVNAALKGSVAFKALQALLVRTLLV